MTSSLVGSEMCIRDRKLAGRDGTALKCAPGCAEGQEMELTSLLLPQRPQPRQTMGPSSTAGTSSRFSRPTQGTMKPPST
eukprot:11213172-Prorocentrum_lima.AAC.1